jgi:hypothetical protein
MAKTGLNCYAEKSCCQIPDRTFTKIDEESAWFGLSIADISTTLGVLLVFEILRLSKI